MAREYDYNPKVETSKGEYTRFQNWRLRRNESRYNKATTSSARSKYFRRDVQMRKNYDLVNSRGEFNSRLSVGSAFTLIFMLLLAVSVFRILLNGQAISLSTLLSQVAGAPTIPTNWIGIFNTDFGSTFPYGLQWLGSIFDFFTELFSFSMFASTAALNVVVFLLYFLRWLFL